MTHLIAIGAALAVFLVLYKTIEYKGVQKEKSRVETIGKKLDAKAQIARKSAVDQSQRVLEKYYRD